MLLQDLTLVFAGLAAYQLLNRCLHNAVKWFSPGFYATLELEKRHKLAPYFVFPLGIILTLFTTPICLSAYNDTPSVTDTFSLDRPFTTNGRICLASRAVLWVSEMPLLSYSPEYVTHHILSLGSLALVLVGKSPRRPLYLIYAGLVTELFSDTVALLRFHGHNAQNSSTFRKVMLANVLSMMALRLVPIVAYIATMPRMRADYFGGIMCYCLYLARLTFLQLGTLGYHQMRAGRDSKIAQSDKHTAKSKLEPCLLLSTASLFRRPMTLVICVAVGITSLSLKELEYSRTLPTGPAITSPCNST